jgi:glycopeptide antibiotics resistance protein
MDKYLNIIRMGFIAFPFLAMLFTFPFIIHNYHKYGSISKLRTIIIYSFILYLLCAYFLIILPLPTLAEVANLTTPRMQLMPFAFIKDFIEHSGFVITNFSTYLPVIKSNYFIQPVFNVVLTIPFGIYLHYYFKYSWLKTTIFSFLLSLFFELTQLSGLYFIYPRGYRLFDVDDLFLNTLGGSIGYFIANIFIKVLPSREKIDEVAIENSKNVSGIRLLTALLIDAIIIMFMTLIIYILGPKKYLLITYIIITLAFMVVVPMIFKSTIGERIVNIKVISLNNKKIDVFFTLLFRSIMLFIMPIFLLYGVFNAKSVLYAILFMIYFIYGFITFFKILVARKLFYEKLFKTDFENTLLK